MIESEYPTTVDPMAKRRLAPLVSRWKTALNAARLHRKDQFECVADEARKFFDGSSKEFWEDMAEKASAASDAGFLGGSLLPQFRISLNRMFDCVAMFGPALYHQNPTIAVTSRPALSVSIDTFYADNPQAAQLVEMIPQMQQAIQMGQPVDPAMMQMAIMAQQQYEQAVRATEKKSIINTDHAIILEALSNYYQNEGHKQDEARLAITEAIITGLGLLEPILESSPAGGPRIPACRVISGRDFLVDPDACYWRDVTWIAIRRVSPRNIVEKKFGLPAGSLKGKGKHASNTELGGDNPSGGKRHGNGKRTDKTHEMIEYFDVFSKNGAGQNLMVADGQPAAVEFTA